MPTTRPTSPLRTGLTLAAALVLGPSAEAVHAQEVFRLSGDELAVHNLAGSLRVVSGSGPDVVVRVTRGGEDGGRLDVRTGPARGRATLRVVYPEDTVVYPAMGSRSRSTSRVTPDGLLGTGGGGRVTVQGSGRGMEAWADLVVEIPAGRDTELHLLVGEADVEGVDGVLRVDTGSGDVRSRGTAGRLTVDTGSGDVEVVGAAGHLWVDTGSGDIGIRSTSGGDVKVDTGSGRVEGSGIQAGSLEVDTGSGDILLEGVSADEVVLDTGSGSVELSLTAAIGDLVVDTGSGSVTIRAPAGTLDGQVELDTGSGRIEVDFPLTIRSASREHLTGTIGSGRGEIRVDTGSGTIRLLEASD